MTEPLDIEAADEIERLRAALKGISIASAGSIFDAARMKNMARQALEVKIT